ncbi:MAG: hypothetical protein A4E39_00337 [Methanoregulaceae archaeon PtaB.Bin152]|nr:MAG: hypothetical protein A4E39_00337 [Methanoregulaceae archaeon PtaB.Bin152]
MRECSLLITRGDEVSYVLSDEFGLRIPGDRACRLVYHEVISLPICEEYPVRGVLDVTQERLFAHSERFFRLLLACDILEHRNKIPFLGTGDRDVEPDFERGEEYVKCFGVAGRCNSAVYLKYLGCLIHCSWDCLAYFLSDNIPESGQAPECRVHFDIFPVNRPAPLIVNHPAEREPFEHVIKECPIPLLAPLECLFCLLPVL